MATPYKDAVLADTPVGYWKLDETTGTVAASQTNTPALDGTYTGTYTLGASDPTVTDTGNNAISLVQSGYVDIPASALLNIKTAITIEAIISPTNNHQGALYNHPTATNGYNSQAEVFLDGGTLYFRLNGTFGQSDLTWNHSALNGTRFHIACRWDGATQAILVNGVSVASKALSGTLADAASAKAVIGHLATTNFYAFNGMLDEVAVYSVALTDTRITAHVAALYGGLARITQAPIETLIAPTDALVRVTQAAVESIVAPTSAAIRVTQAATESIVAPTSATIRVTQAPIEVLIGAMPGVASRGYAYATVIG